MSNDHFHLARFVDAQADDYDTALAEIKSGRKESHWMWYIFPQYSGLGLSETSRYYSIKSIDEARAYREHPILGPRLEECCDAALAIEGKSAGEIFGAIDAMKLKSSATLFAAVSAEQNVFEELLQKYFAGERDEKTIELLGGG